MKGGFIFLDVVSKKVQNMDSLQFFMKVLLAEDDRKMAQLVTKGLKRESLVVDVAHDGQQALSRLGQSSYDIVLLDVLMPVLDGIEVCRQMRDMRMETPVIMLSSRNDVDDKVRGLDIGADDYLPKPFSLEELKARMRAAMRRKNPYTRPVLEVGDVIMDVNRGLVFRGGKPVDLSAKEYQLLEYFMRHKGQVLSRDQIMEGVWGMTSLVVSNAVDVHISHLRTKLSDESFDQLIRTVRGRGYVMDDPSSV